MNSVELYLGTRIFSGWKTLDVTRSLEDISGQFSLGVAVNRADSPLLLTPGMECKLEMNGQRVVTGYIDTVTTSIDDQTRTITVTGRDKTGDLVDCAAIHGKGQWRNVSLQSIASDLCAPFSVAVRWEVKDGKAATPYKQWQIEQGETVFENLARAARHRGVLITSNAQGDLVFTTAGETVADTLILGASAGTVSGTKIKSLDTTLSWQDRFSLYRIKGDNAAGGMWGETQTAEQSTAVSIDVKDPAITRYRPTIIIADDNLSKTSGNARGSWEQKRAMAHGTTAIVTVQGWFSGSGRLWQTNDLVTLKATASGFDELDLLIVTVRFLLDSDSGTLTELELMPREGFDEPAQPEPKGQTGKNSNGMWQ